MNSLKTYIHMCFNWLKNVLSCECVKMCYTMSVLLVGSFLISTMKSNSENIFLVFFFPVIQICFLDNSCRNWLTDSNNRTIFLPSLTSTENNCHCITSAKSFFFFSPQLTTLGNLTPSSTVFFCCDMQERFRPAIKYFGDIISVGQRLVCLFVYLVIFAESWYILIYTHIYV